MTRLLLAGFPNDIEFLPLFSEGGEKEYDAKRKA